MALEVVKELCTESALTHLISQVVFKDLTSRIVHERGIGEGARMGLCDLRGALSLKDAAIVE